MKTEIAAHTTKARLCGGGDHDETDDVDDP